MTPGSLVTLSLEAHRREGAYAYRTLPQVAHRGDVREAVMIRPGSPPSIFMGVAWSSQKPYTAWGMTMVQVLHEGLLLYVDQYDIEEVRS